MSRKGLNTENKFIKKEMKGDVVFYEDSKGIKYQQINAGKIFKVRDGKMVYKRIKQINNHVIKYNSNGVYGFSVWKGTTNLEDRFWSLSDAEQFAKSLT